MGFTKLDSGIIQSSIMSESPETFKVWIALLASTTEDGVARVSPTYLAAVCFLSIEVVDVALEELSKPDTYSRSLNDDGRRIKRIDGGFEVINYAKYRERTYSDSTAAKRQRRYRERKKEGETSVTRYDRYGGNGNASASASSSASLGEEECEKKGTVTQEVEEIYTLYPTRDGNNGNRSTGKCSKDKERIRKHLKTKPKDELRRIIELYVADCKKSGAYLKNFSTFLNNLPDPESFSATGNKSDERDWYWPGEE